MRVFIEVEALAWPDERLPAHGRHDELQQRQRPVLLQVGLLDSNGLKLRVLLDAVHRVVQSHAFLGKQLHLALKDSHKLGLLLFQEVDARVLGQTQSVDERRVLGEPHPVE